MRLAPAAGARGEVRVTIAVDGQAAWRGTLAPGAEPVAVAARLPNGKALSIDVDFGERLGWPAAAVLADPLVVSVPGGRPSPAAAPPAARD